MEVIYYVYVYLDPRKKGIYNYNNVIKFEYEPFYVGKGKGKRMYKHLHENSEKEKKRNPYKNNKINKIIMEKLDPIIIKIYDGVCEKDALLKEIDLIKIIGRISHGGTLTNLTDGGEGSSGHIQSEETKSKRVRSLKQSTFYETVHSDEFRNKMSKIIKSRSDDTIEKIRQSKLGEKNPMYGKTTSNKQKEAIKLAHKEGRIKLTEEGRQKIIETSKARKGKKNKNIRCDIFEYKLISPTGKVIIVYGNRSLQVVCGVNGIRVKILKDNIGVVINNDHINNNNHRTAQNTLNWKLNKNKKNG